MRSFNGKPEPTAYELAALRQMLTDVADAIREVHRPRPPKPKKHRRDGLAATRRIGRRREMRKGRMISPDSHHRQGAPGR